MSTETTAVAVRDDNLPSHGLWGGDDQVTSSDIKTPEIRIVQGNSIANLEGHASPGDVIFTYGSDDAQPTVLVGKKKSLADDYIGYVVAREKFAATTKDGGISFHDQPVRDLSDPESWEGWFFYIAIPELDPIFPARTMMWKSNAPSARVINGFIQRAKQRGDYSPIPIRISTIERQNDKGSWTNYKVSLVGLDEVPKEDVEAAEATRPAAHEMILARQAQTAARAAELTTGDQPEV